ncbi:MAG: DUF3320 domain-containing protein, partial [Bacteroidaceae bacterium]|nr:DUF3320 domain-containing protein [Bacteroidaceae bacterium]
KVSMNFGPLNNKGGERRLNVAVSRARYEMVVFSTLRAEQIDLQRTQAKGVEGLKRFLEFAERGTSALFTTTSQPAPSAIALDIAEHLRAKGYAVDLGVGRSNFKIDLAVADGQNRDRYLLGIQTDGDTYYATKTVRDREVVQTSVLRMLGWNIVRVWAVDWFNNKEQCLAKLVETIQQLQSGTYEAPAEIKVSQAILEAPVQVVAPSESLRRPYESYQPEAPSGKWTLERMLQNPGLVHQFVMALVAQEQPITNTYAYRRVVQHFGLARSTQKLQTLVDESLSLCHSDAEGFDGRRTYWASQQDAEGFVGYREAGQRDAADLPLREVCNLICDILQQQMALPEADLKRIAAQQLGFARVATTIDSVLSASIARALNSGVVVQEADRLRWVGNS